MVLNTMTEIKTNVLLTFWSFFWDYGCRSWCMLREIEIVGENLFLFSAVVFSVMRLLPILQVKAEETMIEESHCASYLTG